MRIASNGFITGRKQSESIVPANTDAASMLLDITAYKPRIKGRYKIPAAISISIVFIFRYVSTLNADGRLIEQAK